VVGCATGYAAAVVGQSGGRVTATEVDRMVARAKEFLAQLGIEMCRSGPPIRPKGDAANRAL